MASHTVTQADCAAAADIAHALGTTCEEYTESAADILMQHLARHRDAVAAEFTAFRQSVSEAVKIVLHGGPLTPAEALSRFIIPEPPAPDYDAMRKALPGSMPDHHARAIIKNFNAELAKRGGRIVFEGEAG